MTSDEPNVTVTNPRKKKSTNQQQVRPPPPPPSAPTHNENDDEGEEDEIVLKYGAHHVIKLFIPVTICLVFVIISLSLIKSYQESGGSRL